MDILAIGATVNFLAALLLTAEASALGRNKLPMLLLVGWLLLFSSGFVPLILNDFQHELPGRRAMQRSEERNVKGYVRSGNARLYLDNKPQLDLPYPNKVRLQGLLDDPLIRRILPANVRPHIHFQSVGSNEASAAFVKAGYDPRTVVPPYETVLGSYTPSKGNASQGSWRSRLVYRPGLPYLRIDVSGYLGQPSLNLVLRDEASGKQSALHPGRPARERWQANLVGTPQERSRELSIIASDENPSRWFAFMEPVEVGRLSYWTLCLLEGSSSIFIAGLVLLLLAILGPWVQTLVYKRSQSTAA
jgi:hypothetical protein